MGLSGTDEGTAALVESASDTDGQAGCDCSSVSEAAPPEIDDPISDAELRDLKSVASQEGISLQEAIDRYAWNDNFALAVARIRGACPEAFADAAIVGADRAWIAFKGGAPKEALDIIDIFTGSHSSVSVEVRTGSCFTETELQSAIEAVHYAVLESPDVLDASTWFDTETGQITTTVVLERTASASVLDDLGAVAEKALTDATRADILNCITTSVVRSNVQVISGTASSTEHLGGEALSDCTSGFGTMSYGVRGICTAGHCSNSQTDDGQNLTFQAEYQGVYGDFQWHTGPQNETDDFYAGSSSTLETDRRDVSWSGSPTVGQTLCRNGKTTYQSCQQVRKLNVCNGDVCNLVQMGENHISGGDSGGPVYWGNTDYGLNRGWMADPFWPFLREVFSRTDKMWYALGIQVATN
ncbi:MAG: hypothetical protein WC562_08620 [Dehalococcoidia bacterium]